MQNNWPIVDAFAQEMKAKLEANKAKKGVREGQPYDDDPNVYWGGWLYDDPLTLYNRIIEEAHELRDAILRGASADVVIAEAADVSNMAMMVADAFAMRQQQRGLLERRQ